MYHSTTPQHNKDVTMRSLSIPDGLVRVVFATIAMGMGVNFTDINLVIVSAARSLTCRDDLDSKWRLLLAENELSRVSLLSRISIEN